MKKKKRGWKRDACLKHKKAQHSSTEIFYFAVCLLFAGFVTYIYIKIAYTGAKSTRFNMEYFANDIGLMTDTIYSVQGDVVYDYRRNPSKFMLNFTPDTFYVYPVLFSAISEEDIAAKASSEWAAYRMLSRPTEPFIKGFMFPYLLGFQKKDGILEVSDTGTFDEEERCPTIYTASDISTKAIYFDAGHAIDEKGYVYENRVEFELTKMIAENLKVLCQSQSLKCVFVQQNSMEERKDYIRFTTPQPDMIISIHIGRSLNARDNPIEATVPLRSTESEKLSCVIKNEFKKDGFTPLPDKKTGLIASMKEDPESILDENIPSVLLEIGNIKNEQSFDENTDISKAAAGVMRGIKSFYSEEQEAAGKTGEKSGAGEAGQPAGGAQQQDGQKQGTPGEKAGGTTPKSETGEKVRGTSN